MAPEQKQLPTIDLGPFTLFTPQPAEPSVTLIAGKREKKYLGNRDEHWTGLVLNWIRTMTILLDLDRIRAVIFFMNLGSGPDLD